MTSALPARSTRFVTLFDETYNKPDSRAYYRMLKSLGYSNHAHAVPVFRAVLDALIAARGLRAPSVFDFASSYGIVSALIRYDISADAFLDWYDAEALDDLDAAGMAERDRAWQAGLPQRYPGASFAGIDVADRAVAYGQAVGVFDHAFAENLQDDAPSDGLRACLAGTDLIVECGSVAHLMPAALDRLLTASSANKPWVVTSPVRGNERQAAFEVLRDHGLAVDTLGLPPFPHRRFDTPVEQARAIEIARRANHRTEGYETTGAFFAQIYVARPAQECSPIPLPAGLRPVAG